MDRSITRGVSRMASALIAGLLLVSGCASSSGSSSATAASSPAPSTPPPPPPAAPAPPAPAATTVPPAPSEHLEGVGSASVITLHGKIVSVNRKKKQVTIEGPGGKVVTLEVKNPYNLKAAKTGEPVVIKYYEIVTIRKLKKGESLPPIAAAQGIATAQPGQTPGGAVGEAIRVVATIVAINSNKNTVDVKGPDGAVETVKVANPKNLKYVKVGDDIVITLTKVMAVGLDKDAPASTSTTTSTTNGQ